MAAIHHAFSQNSGLKRKRVFGEVNDTVLDESREWKRTNITHLPIRTSPTLHHHQTWHHLSSNVQRPLTPVDSSDDESHGQADNAWAHQRTPIPLTRRSQLYQTPSAIDAEELDDQMDLGLTAPQTTKRRSLSPHRPLSLLHAPFMVLEERTPTPIAAKFNLFDSNAKNRCRQAVRQTMLSPVMAEETYLPSPVELDKIDVNTSQQSTMRMEQASDSFETLAAMGHDYDMMESTMHNTESVNTTVSRQTGPHQSRNGKLHMGYLSGCEKCQQRVPGHYSHILWS